MNAAPDHREPSEVVLSADTGHVRVSRLLGNNLYICVFDQYGVAEVRLTVAEATALRDALTERIDAATPTVAGALAAAKAELLANSTPVTEPDLLAKLQASVDRARAGRAQ